MAVVSTIHEVTEGKTTAACLIILPKFAVVTTKTTACLSSQIMPFNDKHTPNNVALQKAMLLRMHKLNCTAGLDITFLPFSRDSLFLNKTATRKQRPKMSDILT